MSSYTMTGGTRKPAANSDRPSLDYAARRIAHRCRISTAQASVIVELLGPAPEVRHD
ncbi:hypothetical protein KBI52_04460 [Microvirga sp. HBU67558]|uniref:hypothetical protein n=1 Tax=Microvirga TaxID=186650 RepID=UPI001B3734BA|nr:MULTISPECIES: hypothetical protein [unclassified Microvirga]MBQ0819476.1 hypothetical protein [Microvirga sp. HBU67558]